MTRPDGRVARYIVGMAGGRPGAGRNVISTNLAAALAATCWRVGLTDVETAAPLVPETLGVVRPMFDGNGVVPASAHGVQLMSLSWLVREAERDRRHPPPLSVLIGRLLGEVGWDNLDLLLIELPPNAEDVRSLLRTISLDGVVIIATPRGAKEGATEAAYTLFHTLRTPVLGMVENLSYYACRNCQQQQAAEYSGAVSMVARRTNTRFLGQFPVSITLRDCLDDNLPAVACPARPPETALFERLADEMTSILEGLHRQEKDIQ